jgi:hypothetical protein
MVMQEDEGATAQHEPSAALSVSSMMSTALCAAPSSKTSAVAGVRPRWGRAVRNEAKKTKAMNIGHLRGSLLLRYEQPRYHI